MKEKSIDDLFETIVRTGEKTEFEIRIEKLIQQSREEYFKEHGKWPEEDGINIIVNL